MTGRKVGQTSVKKIQGFLAFVLNQVSLQKLSTHRTRRVGRKRNLSQNIPLTIRTGPENKYGCLVWNADKQQTLH